MAAPATALPRYVELVRVSSQGQADRDTPEVQRAELRRLRTSIPGHLVEAIEWVGSGNTDTAQRPDIQKLSALARGRAFDQVRVWRLDRLTRHDDPAERFAVYSLVAEAGAVFVDAGGRVTDPRTELGELDYYIQTMMAARERRRILERTAAGKARLAAQGRLVHGRPPFARTFDRATGAWGTDAGRVAFFRRAVDLVLAGHSLREVSRLVADDAPPCPLGGTWSSTRLHRMLADPTATGTYHTHGTSFAIPAIITPEEQGAVLARLKANNSAKGGRPAKVFALLRRLAVCGSCGAPVYTERGGKTRHRHRYYVCSSRGACRGYHRIEATDDRVWAKVLAWLQRPDTLLAAAALEEPAVDLVAERAAAERAIARLADEELRVARLLTRGHIEEATGEGLLVEVARRRAAAERELEQVRLQEATAARRKDAVEALDEHLAAMRAGAATASPAERAELMAILFPRGGVVLHPSGDVAMRGWVELDVAPTGGCPEPSGAWRGAVQFPVRLVARAGRR